MLEILQRLIKKTGILLSLLIILQVLYGFNITILFLVPLSAVLLDVICQIIWHLMPQHFIPDINTKAVLITGCDTGFGHELAKKLDTIGLTVYAGCLFPEGEGALELKSSCSEKLKILHLDVTKDEHVKQAVEFVKSSLENKKLWAVVNNAGIGLGGELEWTPMDIYQKTFEVNAYGPVRICQSFLPLLKKSAGRIVIVASVLGRVSFPGMSAYCMSKYAAVALADSLRRELLKWSISVHTIEPWLYRTNITDDTGVNKALLENWNRAPDCIHKEYGEGYIEQYMELSKKILAYSRPNTEIHEVVNDMVHATIGRNPKGRYVPGIVGKIWTWLYEVISIEIIDVLSYITAPKSKFNTC